MSRDSWRGKKKSYQELSTKLKQTAARLKAPDLTQHELPVLQVIESQWKSRHVDELSSEVQAGVQGNASLVSANFSIQASATDFDKSLDESEVYNSYSDIVLRSFPFFEVVDEIKEMLLGGDFKRLVVFFDDFSELSWQDQRLFVDIILSPLNNSTNDLIKLKIAGYPGRVYYGKIDPTKVDTICLDFASIYEANDVQSMEKAAIDYTRRLLDARFEAFGACFDDYFQLSRTDYFALIFQCTFNVPRLMGALLHTCYLDRISHGLPINPVALRLAARKYYESTISQYFDRMNRFALEPFDNKLDRHNQEQLLKYVVKECREIRLKIQEGSIGGSYFSQISNPPTSHFIVNSNLTDIFQSLESNFLVSKYKDTRDKDGEPVTVFALYYGLVEVERMTWGYPPGREYRNYFVQRCFDLSASIHEFLARGRTIRCHNCRKSYSLEQKSSFELFRWKCPECGDGVCKIVQLADDFSQEVAQLREDLMLEEVELAILNTLDAERKPMRAGEISGLIDVTYQLVGHRTSKLRDRGLVDKKAGGSENRMRSKITEKARSIYFEETDEVAHEGGG